MSDRYDEAGKALAAILRRDAQANASAEMKQSQVCAGSGHVISAASYTQSRTTICPVCVASVGIDSGGRVGGHYRSGLANPTVAAPLTAPLCNHGCGFGNPGVVYPECPVHGEGAKASRPSSFAWLAETIDQPTRYARDDEKCDKPVGTTTDPLRARRFGTRDQCLSFCTSTYARACLPPLHPVEHGFIKQAPDPLRCNKCGGKGYVVSTDENGEQEERCDECHGAGTFGHKAANTPPPATEYIDLASLRAWLDSWGADGVANWLDSTGLLVPIAKATLRRLLDDLAECERVHKTPNEEDWSPEERAAVDEAIATRKADEERAWREKIAIVETQRDRIHADYKDARSTVARLCDENTKLIAALKAVNVCTCEKCDPE